MRQVKAGDTVRIKTAEELAAIGKCFSDCSGDYAEAAGTRQTVIKIVDGTTGVIIVGNGSVWAPDEYVLLPEIPERGDIVYVSNKSEEDAIKLKEQTTLLLQSLLEMNINTRTANNLTQYNGLMPSKNHHCRKSPKTSCPRFLPNTGMSWKGDHRFNMKRKEKEG